jgi:hypothetical protein
MISSNEDADDIVAEVTEKLDQLGEEVNGWFVKHQDQFEEIAPNLVFKIGLFGLPALINITVSHYIILTQITASLHFNHN